MPVASGARRTGEWLSLGPASRRLGVDPDTLRRWADGGRVAAFTTPGGHRRFERRTIDRLAEMGRGEPRSLAGLGGTSDSFAAAYRRGYGSRRGEQRATEARVGLGPSDLEAFRDDGRRLVATLLERLDAADPAERQRALVTATGLAGEMGRRMRSTASDLRAAVALFVAARRPFLAELGAIGRRRLLDPGSLSRLYDEASAAFDALLLAYLDGYLAGGAAAEDGA